MDHQPVAPERLADIVRGQHFRDDPHGGKDEDVDLGVREEPEECCQRSGLPPPARESCCR